jgi:dihydropteroate synthase
MAFTLDLPTGPFSLERIRIMGILNTTPDSFYDKGRYKRPSDALARALQMVEEGADIIDVGGEKAGPGDPVEVEEELRRVIPVIEAIRRQTSVPISVDTFKPEVARAAVAVGADIINSIGSFRSRAMRRVAAESGAGVVVMHIRGEPRIANPAPTYQDVIADVETELLERVAACEVDGIGRSRIIIDPGPGFGKTTEHDVAILRELGRLTALPYPVLLAASRKKFIGDVLGTGVDDRLEGSLAVVAWGVLKGVRIVRAHDVLASKRVCLMTEAVLHPELVEAT